VPWLLGGQFECCISFVPGDTNVSRVIRKLKTCTITAGYVLGGGDEGIRTLDLCVANAPLSHLSYIPTGAYSNTPTLFFNNIFFYLIRI
jgi:hypothetical protein